MPITMKGSPMSSPWSSEPLPRFNKFSPDGGGGSAWPVSDGTLGSFIGSTWTVQERFASSLRDLGLYGVSSKSDMGHPAWKAAVEKTYPLVRSPKRLRRGIAGDELGPAFMA